MEELAIYKQSETFKKFQSKKQPGVYLQLTSSNLLFGG